MREFVVGLGMFTFWVGVVERFFVVFVLVVSFMFVMEEVSCG